MKTTSSVDITTVDSIRASIRTDTDYSGDIAVMNFIDIETNVNSNIGGTIAEWNGLNIQGSAITSVTDKHGIHIGDMTGATTNFAIKTGLGKVSFGDNVSAIAVYSNDIVGSPSERTVWINASGDLGFQSSSEKFKENIRDLDNANWIYDLIPRTYDRKDGSNINEIGMIAEEVNLINPSIISYKRNITYKEVCREELEEDENGEVIEGSFITMCHDEVDKITVTDEPETINYASGEMITAIIKELQSLKTEIQQRDNCWATGKDFIEVKNCIAGVGQGL